MKQQFTVNVTYSHNTSSPSRDPPTLAHSLKLKQLLYQLFTFFLTKLRNFYT